MTTSEDLQRLLHAERAARPPASALQSGWQRLALDLAANAAPMPIAAGPLKLSLWLVPKWILAGFACGLVGAGAVTPLLAPNARANKASRTELTVLAPSSHSMAVPSEVSAVAVDPEPPEHALRVPTLDNRVHVESSPSASASSAPSANAASPTFDAELRLITYAKQDLDAHRPERARTWLDEHAARFPHGVFASERDALSVLARCEQGPKDQALAAGFALLHPGSPLIERLMHACNGSFRAAVAASGSPRSNVDFSKLPNGPAPLGERTSGPSDGAQQ
jgi:hypothetical protein